MKNKLVIFQNSKKNYSAFIDYIIYDYDNNQVEVSIKGKLYIYYNFSYNTVAELADYVELYGAGKAYNWLVKNKNFAKV